MLIGVAMTAANAYLGLYAGMTVAASIPAAIVSMGILRGVLRRGTILENNIVQTIASAGESVAAGVIFTIPALVVAGIWDSFPFWKVTLVAMLGGVLGVVFMVPLRRILIVEEEELIYPEGVACAQVLEAGQTGGKDLRDIFLSLFGGLVFKGLIGVAGLFKGTVEAATRAGQSLFYFGTDISVALIGVGVIVKLEIAWLVFLGGIIGWIVGIPVYHLIVGAPEGAALGIAWSSWSGQIRYMGVGAMLVGGVWSMFSIRHGIVRGVTESFAGLKARNHNVSVERTNHDLEPTKTLPILIVTAIATFFLYRMFTGSTPVALVASVLMVIASFFFVAVSSYIVGLVGTSNNPVSGMTICALIFSSIILLLLGMTGTQGILAALGVAGVVCVAAATAGDCSQDLKSGHLVGATPWKQQFSQLIGATVPVFVIAPVLTLLHKGYGIGTGAPGSLKAPQATLFAGITQALFEDKGMPWVMVSIGVAVAVALIVIDGILKERGSRIRTHVMPVAIGIYLPLSLSVPIFIGGLISFALERALASRGLFDKAYHKAVLIASGLIAGEAIAGILIAIPRSFKWPIPLKLPIASGLQDIISLAGLGLVLWLIYSVSRKAAEESAN